MIALKNFIKRIKYNNICGIPEINLRFDYVNDMVRNRNLKEFVT